MRDRKTLVAFFALLILFSGSMTALVLAAKFGVVLAATVCVASLPFWIEGARLRGALAN